MPKIYVRKEEKKRAARYKLAGEMVNFIMIIVGVLVAVAAAILLVSLVRWAFAEFLSTMKPILDMVGDALIVPE